MSTPPTSPPPQPGQYYGSNLPTFPIPTSELIIFFLVWFVILLVTLVAKSVDPPQFVWGSVVLAFGYMLARGLAKLGKAYENR